MTDYVPLVELYSHLPHLPREQDALLMLKEVASTVKPLMRARGWKIGALTEFYPEEADLCGLNFYRGQKILLRLRSPDDSSLFLPMDHIVDTMLHELAHLVHSPHNDKFHALWSQLRGEQTALALKVSTIEEGFLDEDQDPAGDPVPPPPPPTQEGEDVARATTKKKHQKGKQPGRNPRQRFDGARLQHSQSPGQRLGGDPLQPGQDMRQQIAAAVEARLRTLRGCGNASRKLRSKRVGEITDAATRDGVRTQPDEEAAEEAAIAQALWALVLKDEKAKWGSKYMPPTACV